MELNFVPYKANEALDNYFYIIPIELINSSLYKGRLNSDSILLYSFLLSRFRLSLENNWTDDTGIYVIFPRAEVQEMLNVSDKTITKAFNLLKDACLIREKIFGMNKPNHIYVGKIQHLPNEKFIRHTKTDLGTRKNNNSGAGNSTTLDTENLRGSNIDNRYIDKNIKSKNYQKKSFINYEQRSYTTEFLNSLFCNV